LKLRRGTVASEILLEADEGDYDLIALGASGPGRRPRDLLMVDVMRQVVDRALRPVLVVRCEEKPRTPSVRRLLRELMQTRKREQS